MASLWEITIKAALEKLEFPANLGTYALRQTPTIQVAECRHTAHRRSREAASKNHRDAFDRMIIAQAKVEALTIVTADRAFASYDVAAVWV